MITIAAFVIALVFWPITIFVVALIYWPVTLPVLVVLFILYAVLSAFSSTMKALK
jgi:hypothetical protein